MNFKKEFTLALLLCSILFCDAQNKKINASNRNIQAATEMLATAQDYWLNNSIRITGHSGSVSSITLVNYDLKVSGPDNVVTALPSDSTIFSFDRQDREISYAYYTSGKLYLEKKKEYDNAGRLSMMKEDSYWGKNHSISNYEYNAAGKLVHEIWKGGKASYNRSDYIYDKAGWLIKKASVDGDNDTSYVFAFTNTSKGEKRSVEKYLFRKKTKSVIYEYDKQGRLLVIKDSSFLNSDIDASGRTFADTLVKHRRLKYDKNDNLISEEELGWYIVWQRRLSTNPPETRAKTEVANSDEKVESTQKVQDPVEYEYYKNPGQESDTMHIKYEYDKQGNLILYEIDRNGIKTVAEFVYEYDAKKNWTGIRYFRNGKPAREVKRKIEYYE